jgi:hypothetical protein
MMLNGFREGLRGLSEKRIHVRRPLWAESEDSVIRALLAALLALSLTCCSATNCMGGSIVYNIVNYADLQNGYTLNYLNFGNRFPIAYLQYDRAGASEADPYDLYNSSGNALAAGFGEQTIFPTRLSLGGSTWIIATLTTIPEPGTLTLALLGGACIGAVQWMRRSRQAARAAKSPRDLVAGGRLCCRL